MNILCTICSDLVNPSDSICSTKCGHIFHYECISKWIIRSATCPQCRRKAPQESLCRLYPTLAQECGSGDAVTLQAKLDDVSLQLKDKSRLIIDKDRLLSEIKLELQHTQAEVTKYTERIHNIEAALDGQKRQVQYLKTENKEVKGLRTQNQELQNNLNTLNGMQRVLTACCSEVEAMMGTYTDVRTLVTFVTALKRALLEAESKKRESRAALDAAQNETRELKARMAVDAERMHQVEDELRSIKCKLETQREKRKNGASDNEGSIRNSKQNVELLESSGKQSAEDCGGKRRSMDEGGGGGKRRIADGREVMSQIASSPPALNTHSPYLQLRQGSVALASLRGLHQTLKPSELAVLNAAKKENSAYSIFREKQRKSLFDMFQEQETMSSRLGTAYDGLGGHSRPELTPTTAPPRLRCSAPKLGAKHKLKRPNPATTQEISKFLDKL